MCFQRSRAHSPHSGAQDLDHPQAERYWFPFLRYSPSLGYSAVRDVKQSPALLFDGLPVCLFHLVGPSVGALDRSRVGSP